MSDSSSSDGEDTWIQWFCGLEGHEMFCEIDRGYIEDAFNLYGLRHFVPRINDSLDLILDRTAQNEASHELMEATCALYGLIHARYVLTAAGLEAMYAKYTLQEFGNCPHFLCRGQSVVPLGVRDEPHLETVKLYCPKCQDVYVHPSHAAQRVDGAYFGTTFPHLFFMTYGTLVPDPPEKTFVPRVFGFRVHSTAPNGASASGEQQEQRLQERRRLRGPHPPPPPQQEPGGSEAAVADGGGTGVAVAGAAEAAAQTAAADGAGKGRARGGVEGGGRNGVVVRIKEEEGHWRKGGGGGGGSRVEEAGAEAGAAAAAATAGEVHCGREDGSGGGAGSVGGGGCLESRGAENGHQSSTAWLQSSGTGATDTIAGQDLVESKGVTRSHPSGRGSNAGNAGVSSAAAETAETAARTETAAMAGASTVRTGESKGRPKSTDDSYSGSRRAGCSSSGGGREGVLIDDGTGQKSNAASTAAPEPEPEAMASAPSGGPQERGTKRLSEVELETAALEVLAGDVNGGGGGSGAGERGGVGKARGKVLRGRNHPSPAARGVSSLVSAAPAAVAVEGGGGGSSGRRTGQARSPM